MRLAMGAVIVAAYFACLTVWQMGYLTDRLASVIFGINGAVSIGYVLYLGYGLRK